MKHFLLFAAGLVITSLSSCSRGTYSFSNSVPAYLGTEQVHVAVQLVPAAATSDVAAAPAVAAPEAVAALAPARRATKRAVAQPAAKATVAASTKKMQKAAAKAARQAVRSLHPKILLSPREAKAEGKSQLVALLLCLFLGGLGIHRFYLGYVGLGILELLTFGVFGILSLIDLIRIILGDLKPKDGEYEKKL